MRLWGSNKVAAEKAAIPAEVLAVIEAAAMYLRPGASENVRVVIQPEGYTGFIFTSEGAEKWLKRRFPELTPHQTERCMAYLSSLVKSFHREQTRVVQPGKQSWVNRW